MDELSDVNEIGPIIAESVNQYLKSPFGKKTIDDLAAADVVMRSPRRAQASQRGWREKRSW